MSQGAHSPTAELRIQLITHRRLAPTARSGLGTWRQSDIGKRAAPSTFSGDPTLTANRSAIEDADRQRAMHYARA